MDWEKLTQGVSKPGRFPFCSGKVLIVLQLFLVIALMG